MGTIINLYVIPRMQNPNDLRAAQVAEIIVSKHLVAPPVVIGPAFMRMSGWCSRRKRSC
jgi:hypothetical protein